MRERPAQRHIVPGMHRHLGSPEEVAQCQGVSGRVLQADVATHRRDAHHLGPVECNCDGHRVIQTGVTIQDHPTPSNVGNRASHPAILPADPIDVCNTNHPRSEGIFA